MDNGMRAGAGLFGFGVLGGMGVEAFINKNRVVQGLLVGAPSTASTQATGTGASDFNANITAGLLVVDGVLKEYAAQADFDVASSVAQQMASGQSRIYSIVAYRSTGTGDVALRVFAGAAATTGEQVPVTRETIVDGFSVDTSWFEIARVTVNRTADQTLTQTYDNSVRPVLVAKTVHD